MKVEEYSIELHLPDDTFSNGDSIWEDIVDFLGYSHPDVEIKIWKA